MAGVKKCRPQAGNRRDLTRTVEAFAADMEKVGKYTATAERAITANLSRLYSPCSTEGKD
jgi:hypothetical protein